MWKHCSISLEPRQETTGGRFPKGFTLVEIMLVVGIMAIVLAFGLPAMVRVLDREPLRQAVTDVVEALSHARAHAILQGRRSEMVFNADYRIVVRIAPAPSPEQPLGDPNPWAPQSGSVVETVSAPIFEARFDETIGVTALRVNGGPNLVLLPDAQEARVRFYPNGTSDDFEMDLMDSTGAQRITLDPVTGFADVISIR